MNNIDQEANDDALFKEFNNFLWPNLKYIAKNYEERNQLVEGLTDIIFKFVTINDLTISVIVNEECTHLNRFARFQLKLCRLLNIIKHYLTTILRFWILIYCFSMILIVYNIYMLYPVTIISILIVLLLFSVDRAINALSEKNPVRHRHTLLIESLNNEELILTFKDNERFYNPYDIVEYSMILNIDGSMRQSNVSFNTLMQMFSLIQ